MNRRKLTLHGLNAIVRGVAWVNRIADYYLDRSVVAIRKSNSDPWRDYSILRERGAIVRTREHHGWFVLRYDDVKSALRDERFSSDIFSSPAIRLICELSLGDNKIPFLDAPWIQQLDPPDHTRVRKLITRGFTTSYVQSLESDIRDVAESLLDQLEPDTSFDVVEAFATPLPVLVIGRLLGVPKEDMDWFLKASKELLGISRLYEPDAVEAALKADIKLRDYMATLVKDKRELPGDDLLSRLAAEQNGEVLSDEELYATAVFLLLAGFETTTRMISAGVYLFLSNPDQAELALRNDETLANGLEEVLRLCPPVLVAPRRAKHDFEYLGENIKQGQVVGLCLTSANRDPRIFDDPDTFDVLRDNVSHLSFGHGIHLCLGIALGRLEGIIAMKSIFERFPKLKLVTREPDWGDDLTFRGIRRLDVITDTF